MPNDIMNGGLLILFACTAYFGLAISFSLQHWNALSRAGRPAFDSTCREQIGDCVVAILVFLAVLLVEPSKNETACGIALGAVVFALIVRLVRRIRRRVSRHDGGPRGRP